MSRLLDGVASVVENASSPTVDNVKGFVHLEMSAFADAPVIDDAAELLAAAPLHAIVYGFTSS